MTAEMTAGNARRPKGSVACHVCRKMLFYLVYDKESETYHLECRVCGSTGPLVNLEA